MTPRHAVRLAVAVGLLAGLGLPGRAELGPCKPGPDEIMLCGAGKGAARTIVKTLSPDRKFAFAWHDPQSNPDDVEDFDNEFLLIRLADGVVLARAPSDYFQNARGRANRRDETAIWSADSRRVVRQYDTRYETEAFTLYRIDADGALAGTTDLLKLVEPAVRAMAKGRGRDIADYFFSVGGAPSTLGTDGTLKFDAGLFVNKTDISYDFKVVMTIAPDGTARVVSVREVKTP